MTKNLHRRRARLLVPAAAAAAAVPTASAATEHLRQYAAAKLEGVRGRGDAVAEASMNGVPVAPARSALVRGAGPTDEPAFHAVRVEFADAEDEVLDTVSVGVADAPPDRTVTARADSREAAGVKAFPRVAQAERG